MSALQFSLHIFFFQKSSYKFFFVQIISKDDIFVIC